MYAIYPAKPIKIAPVPIKIIAKIGNLFLGLSGVGLGVELSEFLKSDILSTSEVFVSPKISGTGFLGFGVEVFVGAGVGVLEEEGTGVEAAAVVGAGVEVGTGVGAGQVACEEIFEVP